MAEVNIKGSEDYHKYSYVSGEGNILLDGKGKPIPIESPLKSHIDCKHPIELWNGRGTRSCLHSKYAPPQRGGASNSTTIDKNIPTFNTPLSPITRTAVNMLHPDGFNSEDTIVKDILADPNIHPGLLRTTMDTLHSIISPMKSILLHQATFPAQPHSSGFDHQRPGLEA